MNKKQKMYAAIEAHGDNLNAIFNTDFDSVTLCKKLRRLEKKAAMAATCLCNTNTLHLLELNKYTGYDVPQATEDEKQKFFDDILNSLDKVLGFRAKEIPVFINYDPRGYALKIRSEYVKGKEIMTDWGGDGIISPDFSR